MSRPWIFDLDATLTVPQLDFGALRDLLGLPEGDILGGIARAPLHERPRLNAIVHEWEQQHVRDAQPAPGAFQLLSHLSAHGHPLGIVTRNTRESALETLRVIELAGFFEDQDVLGRACAAPKPAPDALNQLLLGWKATEAPVMVGDHVHDLLAGRAAGATTVWIDHLGDRAFAQQADQVIQSLEELLPR